ncbi:hypothetical protein PM082_013038 [Marasmius tenuissimus]|nr:hypothetical protein PM082_013038 [Marasmius tenuissimus]
MSPSSQKTQNTPYKKYQCRYFDENGQPLHTPCNQGDNCRFVHPTDPNWPGLKCHPFPKAILQTKTPARAGTPHGHRAGAPLVPQTDLFRLECKVEYDEDASVLQHHRTSDNKFHSVRDGDRARNAKTDNTRKKPHIIERPYPTAPAKMKLDQRRNFSSPDDEKASESSDAGPNVVRLPSGPKNIVRSADHSGASIANKLADLLRGIVALSNQAIQDTAKHAENERNLHNYSEMSTTLSKISSSAAAAVATPLADTILEHIRSKERVECNFSALEGEWQNFFGAFTSEINGVIERSVQGAVANIRGEVDSMVLSIREASSAKRKQTDDDYGGLRSERHESSRSRRDERSRSRERKRRRISQRSCSPSPVRRRDGEILPKAVKASFDDILNEIKGKLDLQGTTLHSLQKENSEVGH